MTPYQGVWENQTQGEGKQVNKIGMEKRGEMPLAREWQAKPGNDLVTGEPCALKGASTVRVRRLTAS